MATPTPLPSAFTASDVLTAANMNLLRGATRILQVIAGSTGTQTASTSTVFADTSLTATITPTDTSSQILVAFSQSCFTDASITGLSLQLFRGATSLQTWIDLTYGTAGGTLGQFTFFYLDSPATTSATIYKTQFARRTGTGTAFVQANSANNSSTILLMEISA